MLISEPDEKKSVIAMITNQFVSYKDMSEKLNLLFNDLDFIFKSHSLKEILNYASKQMNTIFNAERLNIWLVDS